MRKIITTILMIFIVGIFFYFTRRITSQPPKDISGSAPAYTSTLVATTQKDASAGSIQKEETTSQMMYDETHMIGDIVFHKSSRLQDLEEHDKILSVYGDINPEAENILELQRILQQYNKKISLAVWQTDHTRALTYNTNQTYFSACTIKIAYALSCCQQIDAGLADENTMLTYQEKHYHKGSGTIRKSAYGTQYSLKTLIDLCLSISDNVAYKMLIDYFGLEYYNEFVTTLGCDSIQISRMWASQIQVNDYIVIWNEVYQYLSSNAKMATCLKKACTNTPFNYGTETLADSIDYSHKSGDNFGEFAAYNDAGIVWEDDTYIYAIFTNSEGTSTDIHTVNVVMEHVYEIMTQ